MEIKCGCDKDFTVITCLDVERSNDKQYINDGGKYDSQCPKCETFYYVEPDYENMMFDLKEMNKQ